jgi:DUF917 family protein
MRPTLLLALCLACVAAMPAHAESPKARTALVIHGGAGVIERGSMSADEEKAVRADLDKALDAGHAVLAKGGSALDAVQAAIRVLEESPHFNAGKGRGVQRRRQARTRRLHHGRPHAPRGRGRRRHHRAQPRSPWRAR